MSSNIEEPESTYRVSVTGTITIPIGEWVGTIDEVQEVAKSMFLKELGKAITFRYSEGPSLLDELDFEIEMENV